MMVLTQRLPYIMPKTTFKGHKSTLDSKICLVCARPFSWRKKWETCWAEVKYCSDRCRAQKNKSQPV